MEVEENQFPLPRRSMRRLALSELNEPSTTPTKSESPDERVIIQRGRRCKPITWSPLDYDRNKILQKSSEKTPDKAPTPRAELISSRLRRRLVMSPSKTSSADLGSLIAKKLKSLEKGDEGMSKKSEELAV
ncbi:hypothetical protein WA026_014058 [Henosepilachna vigintioctopunctata]|uniref:Uncharacterized protein n=1 Tax=Henosepilachna vigintioctopunctata TaxID=420089 RepID=A0AAW1U9H9_9CUCU